jgi:putative SOS response-associated peptidase YedK
MAISIVATHCVLSSRRVPVQDRTLNAYIADMCGRFTRNYTWEQLHALYRLTAPAAIPNLQPRFNACPIDPADTEHDGTRELVEMRWGLVPYWWSKSLKELRLATFNARVETVTTKPFFREPFKKMRCLGRAPEIMRDDHHRAK